MAKGTMRYVLTVLFGLLMIAHTSAKEAEPIQQKAQEHSDPILRPGDVLWLAMPGEESFNLEVTVNRKGQANIPEVGQIQVAELSLSEAVKRIKKQLSPLFVDLSTFEVTIAKRRLVVQVLGYVKNPGSIDLSSEASLQEALNQAGGLLPGAQLDRLQLRRGTSVQTFDYKYYLESGDDSVLPDLQPLDTLFVPTSDIMGNVQMSFDAALKAGQSSAVAQSRVQILGEVNKPGFYDWQEALTLLDILALAEGPEQSADLSQLTIYNKQNGELNSREFDLAKFMSEGGPLSQIPKLSAGDLIMVPTLKVPGSDDKSQWMNLAQEDSIYVMGEVVAPGRYRFNNKLHLLDLLAAAKGPNDKADIHNIRITHRGSEQSGKKAKVSQLDLGLYFESGDESLLPKVQVGDVIYIPGKDRLWLNHHKDATVRVLGAVNKQGRYRFQSPMTLLDLLARAGGLSSSADSSNIVVVKGMPGSDAVNHFDLLDFASEGNFDTLPTLTTGDTVYVLHKQDSYWNRVVENIQDTLSVLSVLKILGAG